MSDPCCMACNHCGHCGHCVTCSMLDEKCPNDDGGGTMPPYVVGIDHAVERGDESVMLVMELESKKVLGSFDPTGMSDEEQQAKALEIARGES